MHDRETLRRLETRRLALMAELALVDSEIRRLQGAASFSQGASLSLREIYEKRRNPVRAEPEPTLENGMPNPEHIYEHRRKAINER